MDLETRRKRLTRDESRRQTRERLIEAAHELFIAEGIETASIDRIAEHAGYSRGAFYSNFETKEDILWEILDRETERVQSELEAVFKQNLAPRERIEALRRYCLQYGGNSNTCLFELDCDLYAIRHPEHRERMAAYLRRDREFAAQLLRGVFDEEGITGKDPDILVGMFVAMAQGMTMQEILSPGSFDTARSETAINLFFEGLFGK